MGGRPFKNSLFNEIINTAIGFGWGGGATRDRKCKKNEGL